MLHTRNWTEESYGYPCIHFSWDSSEEEPAICIMWGGNASHSVKCLGSQVNGSLRSDQEHVWLQGLVSEPLWPNAFLLSFFSSPSILLHLPLSFLLLVFYFSSFPPFFSSLSPSSPELTRPRHLGILNVYWGQILIPSRRIQGCENVKWYLGDNYVGVRGATSQWAFPHQVDL